MKTTKTHSQTDVPSQKSAMPVPNARWVPTRRPAPVKPKAKAKAKDILFPKRHETGEKRLSASYAGA